MNHITSLKERLRMLKLMHQAQQEGDYGLVQNARMRYINLREWERIEFNWEFYKESKYAKSRSYE
jgi:hypothetical protein